MPSYNILIISLSVKIPASRLSSSTTTTPFLLIFINLIEFLKEVLLWTDKFSLIAISFKSSLSTQEHHFKKLINNSHNLIGSIREDLKGAKRKNADLYISKRNFLNRKALVTTVTDDMPIAAAANMGFRRIPKNGNNTPAATGIKTVL